MAGSLTFDCPHGCSAKLTINRPEPPNPIPVGWHFSVGAKILGLSVQEALLHHAIMECSEVIEPSELVLPPPEARLVPGVTVMCPGCATHVPVLEDGFQGPWFFAEHKRPGQETPCPASGQPKDQDLSGFDR